MIKQAHTYLVGALSGVTVIGIAIAVFVVLVSAQVFHELPIVNVSSPDRKGEAVSQAQALPAAGGGATAAITAAGATKAARNQGAAKNAAIAAVPTGGNAGNHRRGAADSGATVDATSPATAVESSPDATGDNSSSSGGNSGSHSSKPTKTSPSQSPSSAPESSSSPGSSGSTGSSGPSTGATGSSGSSGSSGSTGTGTGGTTTTAPVTAGVKPPSVSEGVNETVNGVDENLLGGALGNTGVTEVTEEVVNGAAGPETVVGKTVNGVAEVVNGLLGSGTR